MLLKQAVIFSKNDGRDPHGVNLLNYSLYCSYAKPGCYCLMSERSQHTINKNKILEACSSSPKSKLECIKW